MNTFIFGFDVIFGISFGYKHYNMKSMRKIIKPGCCFIINNSIDNTTTVNAGTNFDFSDVMSIDIKTNVFLSLDLETRIYKQ